MSKQLLFSVTKKDFEVQTFRGSGPGGQHRNKTDSAVRIIHKASGARGQATEQRKQHQNKKVAFRRLVKSKKFQVWLRLETCRHTGQLAKIEKKVDKWMGEENIKVEFYSV